LVFSRLKFDDLVFRDCVGEGDIERDCP